MSGGDCPHCKYHGVVGLESPCPQHVRAQVRLEADGYYVVLDLNDGLEPLVGGPFTEAAAHELAEVSLARVDAFYRGGAA